MSSAGNRLNSGSDRNADDGSSAESDAAAQRAKKLAAIKRAVEAGEYDSDDLLDEAMRQMLDAVKEDSDEQ